MTHPEKLPWGRSPAIDWKLILYVSAGVTLGVVLPRFAFHRPILVEVLVAATVSVISGVLLSFLLSIRRKN